MLPRLPCVLLFGLMTLMMHCAIVLIHLHLKQFKSSQVVPQTWLSSDSSLHEELVDIKQKLEGEINARLEAEQALQQLRIEIPKQYHPARSPPLTFNPLPVPERLQGWASRYAGVPRKYDRTYLIDADDEDARKRRRIRALYGSQCMVVQYDSRFPAEGTYMHASMTIWRRWANLHGHLAAFYVGNCTDCRGDLIAAPWCKVAASLQAMADHPHVVLFLYIDSDSVVAHRFMNMSLMDIANDLAFQDAHSIVLNQDGPGHWCQSAGMRIKTNTTTGRPIRSFPHCINSGTFLYKGGRDSIARKFLESWWSYGASGEVEAEQLPFSYKVRREWPHDQGPVLLAKAKFEENIQVVPHPHLSFMHWANRGGINSKNGYKQMPIMPYCLSHTPPAGCIIEHYCENQEEKQQLLERGMKLMKVLKEKEDVDRPIVKHEAKVLPLRAPQNEAHCKRLLLSQASAALHM